MAIPGAGPAVGDEAVPVELVDAKAVAPHRPILAATIWVPLDNDVAQAALITAVVVSPSSYCITNLPGSLQCRYGSSYRGWVT